MRRIFMVGVSAVASILLMAGCNKQVIDLTYEYSQAQIKMPDGTVIEGKVDSWNDYEGDQLQVKINGTTYLVHSSNVVLWNGTKTKPGEKVASRERGRTVQCSSVTDAGNRRLQNDLTTECLTKTLCRAGHLTIKTFGVLVICARNVSKNIVM